MSFPLFSTDIYYSKMFNIIRPSYDFKLVYNVQYSTFNIKNWHENMLGYLSADIISSEKRTVFRERSSTEENCELRGTDNVQGEISEHIFAPNGGYCLYYPSNLLRSERTFENWGIFNNYSPKCSRLGNNSTVETIALRVYLIVEQRLC